MLKCNPYMVKKLEEHHFTPLDERTTTPMSISFACLLDGNKMYGYKKKMRCSEPNESNNRLQYIFPWLFVLSIGFPTERKSLTKITTWRTCENIWVDSFPFSKITKISLHPYSFCFIARKGIDRRYHGSKTLRWYSDIHVIEARKRQTTEMY